MNITPINMIRNTIKPAFGRLNQARKNSTENATDTFKSNNTVKNITRKVAILTPLIISLGACDIKKTEAAQYDTPVIVDMVETPTCLACEKSNNSTVSINTAKKTDVLPTPTPMPSGNIEPFPTICIDYKEDFMGWEETVNKYVAKATDENGEIDYDKLMNKANKARTRAAKYQAKFDEQYPILKRKWMKATEEEKKEQLRGKCLDLSSYLAKVRWNETLASKLDEVIDEGIQDTSKINLPTPTPMPYINVEPFPTICIDYKEDFMGWKETINEHVENATDENGNIDYDKLMAEAKKARKKAANFQAKVDEQYPILKEEWENATEDKKEELRGKCLDLSDYLAKARWNETLASKLEEVIK